MKFYRVSYHANGGNHFGYSWHTSRREAEKHAKMAIDNNPDEYDAVGGPPDIEELHVNAKTKAALLDVLQTYASHPDNG